MMTKVVTLNEIKARTGLRLDAGYYVKGPQYQVEEKIAKLKARMARDARVLRGLEAKARGLKRRG